MPFIGEGYLDLIRQARGPQNSHVLQAAPRTAHSNALESRKLTRLRQWPPRSENVTRPEQAVEGGLGQMHVSGRHCNRNEALGVHLQLQTGVTMSRGPRHSRSIWLAKPAGLTNSRSQGKR